MKFPKIVIILLCSFLFASYFTSSRNNRKQEKRFRPLTSSEKQKLRENLVSAARSFAGKQVRLDCAGLILKIFELNRVVLFSEQAVIPKDASGVKIIYATLKKYNKVFLSFARADKGDLIFFNNTYDMNRNGRADDPLSHVAIITEKKNDGTIIFIHDTRKGVRYDSMNISRKSDIKFNSWLRAKSNRDPSGMRYLTGELFFSFGSAF